MEGKGRWMLKGIHKGRRQSRGRSEKSFPTGLMDRSKRATYTPPTDGEATKRGTISERPAGKAERARASTLMALGLADEKAQALTEASLLSSHVDDPEAITAGSYNIEILGTDLAAKKPGKAYTVYKVEVTHDISTWIIYRRYSQFYALLEELKGEYGKKVSKGFPPKKFIHNLSPASIDRRHQQLQDWLQSMLNDKWVVGSTALQLFIKAGKEDADFVPRQHASTINSDIDMATTLFKLDGSKWKSRWFVLRHGRLYKYASPQEKHPYGFYDLRQAHALLLSDSDLTLKNARNYAFVVDSLNTHTQKSKRYVFSATTDDIMKGWISCINQEVSRTEHNKVFGVPMADIRDRDENGVPLFLSALLTFLEATALAQEDLFTKPPDEEIKRAIDRGKTLDLTKVAEDAHAVAGLIVQYLHELPDSVIPEDICPTFYGIFEIKDSEKRLRMLSTLSEILPIVHRNLLIKLFSFLHLASSQGKVKRERLSKIFARIIFRVSGDHQINLQFITETLIDHWDTLVVADEVYAAPEKVLVVKKKKNAKSPETGASGASTGATPTKSSAKGTDSKPAVFNDYYDSNEEFEESSEEEEWTDDEVQVISEISEYSSEEYEESDEEEEYSEEGLIEELSKAAADLPTLPPPSPRPSVTATDSKRSLTSSSPPGTPKGVEDKKKESKEAKKAAKEAEKAEAEALKAEKEREKADKLAKEKADKLAKEKAEKERIEKEKADAKERAEKEKAAAKAEKDKIEAEKLAAKESKKKPASEKLPEKVVADDTSSPRSEKIAASSSDSPANVEKDATKAAANGDATAANDAEQEKTTKKHKRERTTDKSKSEKPSSNEPEATPSEKPSKKPKKEGTEVTSVEAASEAPKATDKPKKDTDEGSKMVEKPKKDATDVEAKKTEVKSESKKEAVETPKKGNVDTPKKEGVETPKKDVVEAPKKDVVETPKKDAVEAPKKDTAETPKKDVVDTPKKDVNESKKEAAAETAKKSEAKESSVETPPASTNASPNSLKSSGKRVKKGASAKRVKKEPSRRPANQEVIAGVPTNNPTTPALNLENVEAEEQPIGSPSHKPLATPLSSRPRKQITSQAPTGAKSPHTLPQRAAEPALTPQEQLVADLGRVLGRRPVGGVALFPMPAKK